MNVAVDYPVQPTDGVPWFRPVRPPGISMSQWGWTSQPKFAHPDYQVEIDSSGRAINWRGSLVNEVPRIQVLMDKRRQAMENTVIETGETTKNPKWVLNRGRYEGFATSLAVLRGTSIQAEIVASNERLGIS